MPDPKPIDALEKVRMLIEAYADTKAHYDWTMGEHSNAGPASQNGAARRLETASEALSIELENLASAPGEVVSSVIEICSSRWEAYANDPETGWRAPMQFAAAEIERMVLTQFRAGG
ncbi:sigma54-dependent transcription regulator [Acidovorax soli]|uniref:Sigma54-dependent transcription regulator n=1 Tax=Acidovorax soli TaxID=592050 RepID=A0A7X0PCZ1_9BURK|nr:hypothetical protein [Acidovorax soli]MBB6559628.1 sigma54-dependent transcription regulator [Acidovorax soli]